MLTEQQCSTFRRILAAQVERVRAGQPGYRDGPTDLGALRGALERLEDGRFGWCQACGASLGYLELAANPVAQVCADCDPAGASPLEFVLARPAAALPHRS